LIPLFVMLIDFFLDFHERIYNANGKTRNSITKSKPYWHISRLLYVKMALISGMGKVLMIHISIFFVYKMLVSEYNQMISKPFDILAHYLL